jgi:hypothetical protein
VNIVKESIELAKKLAPEYPDVPVQELAVEIAVCTVISSIISGKCEGIADVCLRW